jgi:hypothetical protein
MFHEGDQSGEINSIADKWGWCAETIPLFVARYYSLGGQ